METNYRQIDKNLYKVHISADVFEELVKEFKVEDAASCRVIQQTIGHTADDIGT